MLRITAKDRRTQILELLDKSSSLPSLEGVPVM